jgi:hypothetical protein
MSLYYAEDSSGGDRFYAYAPSVVGDAILLAAFALLIPIVLYWGSRCRTFLFSSFILFSLVLEILRYSGRILLHDNPDSRSYFLLASLGTVLGPTFILIAMVCVFPRMLHTYGDGFCLNKPRSVGLVLDSLSYSSLVVELVGVVLMVHGGDKLNVCHSILSHDKMEY